MIVNKYFTKVIAIYVFIAAGQKTVVVSLE